MNEIKTPQEFKNIINSIPCEIETSAVALLKKSGKTEVDLSDCHAYATNASGEEEAEILSAVLDTDDNTIRLQLDTTTDCDWGYISDQDVDTAWSIYYTLFNEIPQD